MNSVNSWRYLYRLTGYLLLPAIALRLLWRSRRAPKYRHRWGERLGWISKESPKSGGVWVHAVSVGEVIAATPLIKRLLQTYPECAVIVTTMTPTGSEQLQKAFGDSVFHVYCPYDYSFAIRRFLDCVQPSIAIMMETELWPNIIWQTKARNIPVMVANARLSARSAQKYRRFATLTKDMLTQLYLVAAQSRADGDRFLELGLPEDKLVITGSVKFDISAPSDDEQQWALQLRKLLGAKRKIWLAASTHNGEDELVLAAFRQVKQQFPESLLILVPRHPERFTQVATMCAQHDFKVVRRSQHNDEDLSEVDIYLGDTMGELGRLYLLADLAFVGGSLVPVGGHNVLEAIAAGSPVVVGPHMFNFAEITCLLAEQDAIIQINDATQLAQKVLLLLQDATLNAQHVAHGQQVLADNRGALDRLWDLVKSAAPIPL